MKANPPGPEGLALEGASAVLRGLSVESTTACAARLASAPLQSQRGSRGTLRQAPSVALAKLRADAALETTVQPVGVKRRRIPIQRPGLRGTRAFGLRAVAGKEV